MICITPNSMLRLEWFDESLTGRRAHFVNFQ
jgi:hypothetical protein